MAMVERAGAEMVLVCDGGKELEGIVAATLVDEFLYESRKMTFNFIHLHLFSWWQGVK